MRHPVSSHSHDTPDQRNVENSRVRKVNCIQMKAFTVIIIVIQEYLKSICPFPSEESLKSMCVDPLSIAYIGNNMNLQFDFYNILINAHGIKMYNEQMALLGIGI